MAERYFKYLGKTSNDFNLTINPGVSNTSPARDVEYIAVNGLDGEVSIDNNRLKNVTKSFPVTSDGVDIEDNITAISNWLKGSRGWNQLEDSEDPKYIYIAQMSDEYEFDTLLSDFGKSIIKFVMKPYKYLKIGLDEIVLPSTINNPTGRVAKPIITIKGTGNITLKIGTSTLSLKSVDSGVIIDSLTETITSLDGSRTQFNKMTSYPFPKIAPGNQTITTSGTITECKIIPRWEVII